MKKKKFYLKNILNDFKSLKLLKKLKIIKISINLTKTSLCQKFIEILNGKPQMINLINFHSFSHQKIFSNISFLIHKSDHKF